MSETDPDPISVPWVAGPPAAAAPHDVYDAVVVGGGPAGSTAAALGLTGEEQLSVTGVAGVAAEELVGAVLPVTAGATSFEVRCRIDTPVEAAYFRHGGILPFVLRQLLRR